MSKQILNKTALKNGNANAQEDENIKQCIKVMGNWNPKNSVKLSSVWFTINTQVWQPVIYNLFVYVLRETDGERQMGICIDFIWKGL